MHRSSTAWILQKENTIGGNITKNEDAIEKDIRVLKGREKLDNEGQDAVIEDEAVDIGWE